MGGDLPVSFRLALRASLAHPAGRTCAEHLTSLVMQAPFTVNADIGMGERAAPWIRAHGADVVVRRGPVPTVLPNPTWHSVAYQLSEGKALITVPCGIRFLVEGGESIRWTVDEGRGATEVDVRTFLVGAAWPALALQRGFVPLHASAVSRGGAVHAFAAAAGGGKSTLAAALAGRGWSFFADDVLLVAPAPAGQEILCHSLGDLKLPRDGLAMVGAAARGPVRASTAGSALHAELKVYAEPREWSAGVGGRFATLHGLEGWGSVEADSVRIERLTGLRAVDLMWRAVYNRILAQEIVGQRRLCQAVGAASRHVPMSEFHFSSAANHFEEVLERLARDLSTTAAAGAK